MTWLLSNRARETSHDGRSWDVSYHHRSGSGASSRYFDLNGMAGRMVQLSGGR